MILQRGFDAGLQCSVAIVENGCIKVLCSLKPGLRYLLTRLSNPGFFPPSPAPAVILFTFLMLCLLGAKPGCPVGYNGPGGLSEDSAHVDCTGGIHKYIDQIFFTSKHFFADPTCRKLYDCGAYDPEGLLGSLSACMFIMAIYDPFFQNYSSKLLSPGTLTYLGLTAGRVVLHMSSHKDR